MADEPAAAPTPAPAAAPDAGQAAPAPAGSTVLGGAPPASDPSPPTDGQGNGAPPPVPETYQFQPPEDFHVDDKAVEGLRDIAKDLKLTQEQFDKLSAFGIDQLKGAQAAPRDAWQATQSQWMDEIAGDRELGMKVKTSGQNEDGSDRYEIKLQPSVEQDVQRVMQQFGSPALTEALFTTGAGNSPAVIRFVRDIGRAMGAAGSLDIGKPAGAGRRGPLTHEQIAADLYPNMSAGA